MDFDVFLRIYDQCRRRRNRSVPRASAQPFNAVVAGSRLVDDLRDGPGRAPGDAEPRVPPSNALGPDKAARSSLLAATLGVRLHSRRDDGDGGKDGDAGDDAGDERDRKPAPAEAPAKSRGARVKDAFTAHDLYGDREMPGEMAWDALPEALAAALPGAASSNPKDVARVASGLEIPPHYPLDITQFRRLVDELDRDGARNAEAQRGHWVDAERDRRGAAAAKYRDAQRGAANTGTFCDAEPLMDPEIRAVRRAAMRNRRRREGHG